MDVIKCDKCDRILPVSTAQILMKSTLLLGKAVRVLDIPVFWTSDGTRRCLDRWTWANLRESFRWSGRAKMVDLAVCFSLLMGQYYFLLTMMFWFTQHGFAQEWDPTTTNLLIRYQRGYSGMYLHTNTHISSTISDGFVPERRIPKWPNDNNPFSFQSSHILGQMHRLWELLSWNPWIVKFKCLENRRCLLDVQLIDSWCLPSLFDQCSEQFVMKHLRTRCLW